QVRGAQLPATRLRRRVERVHDRIPRELLGVHVRAVGGVRVRRLWIGAVAVGAARARRTRRRPEVLRELGRAVHVDERAYAEVAQTRLETTSLHLTVEPDDEREALGVRGRWAAALP